MRVKPHACWEQIARVERRDEDLTNDKLMKNLRLRTLEQAEEETDSSL